MLKMGCYSLAWQPRLFVLERMEQHVLRLGLLDMHCERTGTQNITKEKREGASEKDKDERSKFITSRCRGTSSSALACNEATSAPTRCNTYTCSSPSA